MTAVDTNVLVRVITNDDPKQAIRAAKFLREQDSVFVAKTVLLELEWVLRSAYGLDRRQLLTALRGILTTINAEIEDESGVISAIDGFEKGLDFADSLHLASAGRERSFATFDEVLRRKAARLSIGTFATI